MSINLTIMQLLVVVLVAINIIMPVLYSAVITVLFINAKRKLLAVDRKLDELDMMTKHLSNEPKKKPRNPVGFAVEEGKNEKETC